MDKTLLILLTLLLTLLVVGCGGGGASPVATDGSADPVVEQFDPLLVRSEGSRAYRLLGRHFARRGDTVAVTLHARTGTPFLDGTSAVLEAVGKVDSDRQVRGTLPDPRIPRTWPGVVEADVEVRLAGGGRAMFTQPGARLEPDALRITGTEPVLIQGTPPGPATLLGEGFGPVGSSAVITFRTVAGTPFLDETAASVDVVGSVLSPTQIAFTSPEVDVTGSWFCEVAVRLEDGSEAASDRWYARFEGPPPPPPFTVGVVIPSSYDTQVPSVMLVQGSELTPVGGIATITVVAASGTPFRGGTTDRLTVEGLITSSASVRALSPLPGLDVLTLAPLTLAEVYVRLPDGREEQALNTIAFVPHVGTPRVVINEVDYDQPGVDTGEYVELYNAGDGPASLGDYTLQLVNGTGGGGTIYQGIPLPDVSLPPGGYFVVAGDSSVVPEADLDVSPDSNLIQNGAPDAVGLVRSGSVVDALSYEGDAALPWIEGTGVGLVDDASASDQAIGRFLDGADTNANASDFDARTKTPGASNTGRPERLLAVGALGSPSNEGHVLQLSPSEAQGISLGAIVGGDGLGGLAFDRDGRLFATSRSIAGTSDLLALSPIGGQVVFALGSVTAGGTALDVADLAAHPHDGSLFALVDEGTGAGRLVRVSTADGRATEVGVLPLAAGESVGGLAFTPSGTLYATTRGSVSRLLTLRTSDALVLTSVPLLLSESTGLAVRPADGVLFATVAGSDAIWKVETTGTATPLGATGVGEPADLAFQP
ncbi:MAG: lamin tail domain-containing protein [Planctomycetota bacterium]